MGKPRKFSTYHFKVRNTIVHRGFTDDLERREQEHQKKWPSGHIVKVGRLKTKDGALEWEKKKGFS